MKKINLQDKVRLVSLGQNGFGDSVIVDEATVKAAFFEGMSTSIRNNTDMIETYDAHCYIDETDPFVLDHSYRLEGMFIIANLYGNIDEKCWYRVRDVKLGITKTLDNVVNNCHCFLQKVEAQFVDERSS